MSVPGAVPARRVVGDYEITSEIARGGMAIVHRARQQSLGREVALKELANLSTDQAALAERFVREAQVAGGLVNEHIVHVYDAFKHDGVPYIAMELVERGSLRPYVGALTFPQIAGVLEGMLAGLAHAHAQDVIHRDLKPENVLVGGDGTVKIADFGIAKAVRDAYPHLTQTGTVLGTPTYMAPEQAMGGTLSPSTDLYAVGVTTYELLLGRPPFVDAGGAVAVLMQHINDPVPAPHSIDPALDDEVVEWLERMLAKTPAQRPASARDAWDAFEDIAVRLEGSFWRRAARLPAVGMPRHDTPASAPLDEAEFPSQPSLPTPEEHTSGYVTFAEPPPFPPRSWPEPARQPGLLPEPRPEPVPEPEPEPEPTVIPIRPEPARRSASKPVPPPVGQLSTTGPSSTDTTTGAPRHRRRTAAAVGGLVAVAAVAVAVALPGPGANSEPTLPLGPVEAQIRDRLEPVNSVQSVRCPGVPQEQGHTFECVAVLAGDQEMSITVEQLNDHGRVRIQPHV